MPAAFEQGFFVRQPAWHKLGIVLDGYPGREEAIKLAGHDFRVIERKLAVETALPDFPEGFTEFAPVEGWKALTREDNGHLLSVQRDSYAVVQNDVLWDIVDAMVNEPNVRYETAGVLKGGAVLWVMAKLDTPIVVPGDNSLVFPYITATTTHDGSGSLKALSHAVRIVCANTHGIALGQAAGAGTEYTFRHTRHVAERLQEARSVVRATAEAFIEFQELARELGVTPVTEAGVGWFLEKFVPMPSTAIITDRVAANVDEARAAVRAVLDGQTTAEAHRRTAWGLYEAGVEYLDHLRGYRTTETLFGRAILDQGRAKAKVLKLARDAALVG